MQDTEKLKEYSVTIQAEHLVEPEFTLEGINNWELSYEKDGERRVFVVPKVIKQKLKPVDVKPL
jgi:hypothetical protein